MTAHHFSAAARNIAEVVVPLLAEDGGPAHQGDHVLVLGVPGVLQIPELDMPGNNVILKHLYFY